VDVTDEPYTMEYEVDQMISGKLFRTDFRLGFRVEQRISVLFRKVVEELVNNGEVDIVSQYPSLKAKSIPGDFRFVVIEKILANTSGLNFLDWITASCHRLLKLLSISETRGFGLDSSSVSTEKVPLMVEVPHSVDIKRVK